MGKTPTDSLPSLFKKTGSTSRLDIPSDSFSDCLIDVSLPEELITEILVRLPVKSLFKFKCVSKSWLSFISNPEFIWSLFSKSCSIEADDLDVHLLFATKTGMKKCSLYSALHEADPSTHVSALEFLAQNMHNPIVGIINGLVCLNLKGTDLCVWYPALNKIKHLNRFPRSAYGGQYYFFFSFGYEESNDDYKVVCLQTGPSSGSVFHAEVSIYSLNADSWKRIHDLKGFFLSRPGVFVNGKIYWSGDLFGGKIVSLDMSSEKFVELQPPNYDSGDCQLRMQVSGGLLLMLCDYWKGEKVDLWVLDNHGVEQSWCKFVSIPRNKLRNYNYQVLCILSSGEIVFGKEYGLLVYNWKKKKSRSIRLDDGITIYTRIAAYVESLVWPDYA